MFAPNAGYILLVGNASLLDLTVRNIDGVNKNNLYAEGKRQQKDYMQPEMRSLVKFTSTSLWTRFSVNGNKTYKLI